jgi:hypothetical protein
MEPTHEPVPQDEPGERHEAEESMRYPEHGDPETLRERAGLRDRDEAEAHDAPTAGPAPD